MKRFFVFLLLFVGIVCGVSAASIKATGYGATEEEARADARIVLSEEISTQVYSNKITTTTYTGSNVNQNYSSVIGTISDNILIGVIYGNARKTGKTFSVTAEIPSSALQSYKQKATSIVSQLETNDALFSSIDDEDYYFQESIIAEQLVLYNQLDSCNIVITILSDSKASLIKTKAKIRSKVLYESMYDTVLSMLLKEERLKYAEYSSSTVEFLESAVNAREMLELTEAAIDEILGKMALRDEQKKAEKEQLLAELSTSNIRIAEQYYNNAIKKTHKNSQTKKLTANELVDEIERKKKDYSELLSTIHEVVTQITEKADAIYDARAIEVRNRPYRQADYEMNKKGEYVVSAAAKAQRQEELDIILSEKKAFIESAENDYKKSISSEQMRMEKYIKDDVKNLKDTVFNLSSFNKGEINFSIASFDSARMGWPISLSFEILGKMISLETTILLSDLTGIYYSKPSEMKSVEYKAFQNDVEVYQAFLFNAFDVLSCSISFSVSTDSWQDSSTYLISLNEVKINRLDTDSVILKKDSNALSGIVISKTYPAEQITKNKEKGVDGYRIGETGPAGGIIFYINDGTYGNEWKYLEMAPNDLSEKYDWAGAVNACNQYSLGSFSDWFLPTIDQLSLMWTNTYSQGYSKFKNGYYWSSTSSSDTKAWLLLFTEKGTAGKNSKTLKNSVRPIRAF